MPDYTIIGPHYNPKTPFTCPSVIGAAPFFPLLFIGFFKASLTNRILILAVRSEH